MSAIMMPNFTSWQISMLRTCRYTYPIAFDTMMSYTTFLFICDLNFFFTSRFFLTYFIWVSTFKVDSFTRTSEKGSWQTNKKAIMGSLFFVSAESYRFNKWNRWLFIIYIIAISWLMFLNTGVKHGFRYVESSIAKRYQERSIRYKHGRWGVTKGASSCSKQNYN